ncbi:hypothetical protein PPYR_01638 [Photinus pyralis]|uniref:Uncharacterized protein n=1 Tax=Photinus pyralis TaxID=7054 RepID=A0A5N4B555_PHOPY|nr:hypothetical protein PPYR_01638 [Photinus pyralis]
MEKRFNVHTSKQTRKYFATCLPGIPQCYLCIVNHFERTISQKKSTNNLAVDLLRFLKHPITKDVEMFMGELPNDRLEPTFPLFPTGVDYGNPILIKLGYMRSGPTQKERIVFFICIAAKAIHLKMATSATFIACLQRFISRQLKILFNHRNRSKIGYFCAGEDIEWNIIPPRASHFGGEWKAGVKSMKLQYKRIVGNANLTYEETLTLLVQIENILNSRPINAMSNDPNDFNPLTPPHFLIARSLFRWERIVQIRQHLWKRRRKCNIGAVEIEMVQDKTKDCSRNVGAVERRQSAFIKMEIGTYY